jgi:nitroreductase
MLAELTRQNRSCRRFDQGYRINEDLLRQLVDLARLSGSAQNLQPLKYILSCTPPTNDLIFSCLGWAGYLADWKGPAEGERPSAYVVVLGDTEISKQADCDLGIAAQSLLLGAREMGLGGCMIASINREKLARILGIESRLKTLLVIALGKPAEAVAIDPVGADGDIRYWRDDDGVHHVPKRALKDIIVAVY